jgi:hypothetical protein
LSESSGVGRDGGLHADLDGFEWAEEDVGDEFGGRGGSEVDDGLWCVGEELLAVVVSVEARSELPQINISHAGDWYSLEHLIRSVLSSTLESISHESWTPSCEDPTQTLSLVDLRPRLEVGGIELAIDLSAAFDEIERCDGCVGGTAGDNAAQCALFVMC